MRIFRVNNFQRIQLTERYSETCDQVQNNVVIILDNSEMVIISA